MMPDNIPQKIWKKALEFLDALANGTTDAQQLTAEEVDVGLLGGKLQEKIVRTQAEEAAKATYYYTDRMGELKKECDALAGALQDCLDTLRYTRAFMLKKHGTTNPAREDAIAAADAALARHKGKNDDW
jgi:hypothetical protein